MNGYGGLPFNPLQSVMGPPQAQPGQGQGIDPLATMTPEQRRAAITSVLALGQADEANAQSERDLAASQSSGGPVSGYGALGGFGQGFAALADGIKSGVGSSRARAEMKSREGDISGHRAALAKALGGDVPSPMDPLYYVRR